MRSPQSCARSATNYAKFDSILYVSKIPSKAQVAEQRRRQNNGEPTK